MGTNRISKCFTGRTAASSLLVCVGAGAILLTAALALAQESANSDTRASAEKRGLFGDITHWFDEQTSNLGSHFRGARSGGENLGHGAGIAPAGALARPPPPRVVTGHEKCTIAPSGAPDCVVAANAICKTKGFESGKSVDMTTAEICPAQVYISGRNSGEGCHTETFVSRALCQ